MPGYSYTRDGSYLRLREVSSTTREVHFPDGSIHTFVKGVNSYFLDAIRDAWGNRIQVSYRNSLDQVLPATSYDVADMWKLFEYDSANVLMRTHIIRFGVRSPLNAPANYNRQVSEIELATFGGTTAKYILSYTDTTIAYSCQGDYRGTSYTPDPTVPLLTTLSIPDGAAGAAGSGRTSLTRAADSFPFHSLCGSFRCRLP